MKDFYKPCMVGGCFSHTDPDEDFCEYHQAIINKEKSGV